MALPPNPARPNTFCSVGGGSGCEWGCGRCERKENPTEERGVAFWGGAERRAADVLKVQEGDVRCLSASFLFAKQLGPEEEGLTSSLNPSLGEALPCH